MKDKSTDGTSKRRRLPGSGVVWFAVLVAALFLILCAFVLVTSPAGLNADTILGAFVGALAASMLGFVLLWFARWLFRGRNFVRFIFAVACFVTLAALAYAVENWRGKRAWDHHRRLWESKGEKFAIADLQPAQVPAEKNFALTPLLAPVLEFTRTPEGAASWKDTNALARLEGLSAMLPPGRDKHDKLVLGNVEKNTFADLQSWAEFYRGNTNYPQAPGPVSPAEEVLVALAKFDPELKELHEVATSRPYARFPLEYEYEPTWGILLPHLARIKALVTLVHVRATAELAAGKSEAAMADLKLGSRLSDSIREEPILISHLVRIATLSLNLQTVREGLARHAWTEAQLSEIQSSLASVNLLAEYGHAMRGERAFAVNGFDYLRRLGFWQNPANTLGDSPGLPPLNFFPRGWYYQNMVTLSDMHQRFTLPAVDPEARRVYPEISEAGSAALSDMPATPYSLLAKTFLPALEKAVLRSARMQVSIDAATVACALERYRLAKGQLPESLDVLVPTFIAKVPNDVIDGKPLRWNRQADGGYVLYSIGWNREDDAGQPGWDKDSKEPRVDLSTGDWAWQMPPKP